MTVKPRPSGKMTQSTVRFGILIEDLDLGIGQGQEALGLRRTEVRHQFMIVYLNLPELKTQPFLFDIVMHILEDSDHDKRLGSTQENHDCRKHGQVDGRKRASASVHRALSESSEIKVFQRVLEIRAM